MERAEVAARVRKVIAAVLEMREEDIPAEANFVFDLGADSIQSLELVAAFEEEFAVQMDEAEALGVQTVDGAVEFIQKLLGGGE
ncbi:MAG: acyl carrier protein [Spirochaetales bacterium]|nr:acyl carrier protein [Spirochaetales bacterium]